MRRLYYSIAAAIIWFSLLFNMEWLVSQFQISPFLYIFLPASSVIVIEVLRHRQIGWHWIFIVAGLVYGALRYALGDTVLAADVPTIISEISAVGVTLLLSCFVGHQLSELQHTLANLVIGNLDGEVTSFEQGQGAIYREIRRARRHHHSLALVTISAPEVPFVVPQEQVTGVPFNKHFVVEMQREFGKKYILTRIADVLIQKLEDSTIVTLMNDHFVVLLPETSRDELQVIVQMLQATIEEKLGLKVHIGSATFPDQAITFEDLLAQAEVEMHKLPATDNAFVRSPGSLELASADSNNGSTVA